MHFINPNVNHCKHIGRKRAARQFLQGGPIRKKLFQLPAEAAVSTYKGAPADEAAPPTKAASADEAARTYEGGVQKPDIHSGVPRIR